VAEEILGNALGVPYTVDPGRHRQGVVPDRPATDPRPVARGLRGGPGGQRRGPSASRRQPGAGAARQGPLVGALRDPGAIAGGRRGGYDVVAVPLSFSTPTEVAKALEAMTGSKAVLYSNDKLGLIVLGGSGSELQSLLETIKVLDRNVFEGARIRWFDLHQAAAGTVAPIWPRSWPRRACRGSRCRR
jgi:general secretion pathway protein D